MKKSEKNQELKVLRKLKGYSQCEVAAVLGCSQTRLSFLESGKLKLTDQEGAKIYQLLGEDD